MTPGDSGSARGGSKRLTRRQSTRLCSPVARCVRFERLEPRLLLSGTGERYLFAAELYADAELTTPGLVGTYIDHSLPHVREVDDWRITQPVAGTRLDSPVEFLSNSWGSRASVGLTGGTDANWDRFSVQWDGYLKITTTGQRIATVSDDGSRMWIDINGNGVFEDDELFDNGWGDGQHASNGERTPGLDAGVYAIRIQYYELGGSNVFTLATPPYVPEQFEPTPTNPQQVVRVIGLNFEPRVPSEQNRPMHEVFHWSDPRRLATEFKRDLEWATGGAIDFQIVEWRDLDAFPTFTDGFRYNPDQYVQNRRSNSGWHDTGTDFYRLIESQDLLPLVNSGMVDEIWTFGDHYFDILGEAWMGGPNSFFINGPWFSDAGFDRAIAGYGFSYERGVAEMLHNLSHRAENHGQRAFGSWNLEQPATVWDQFSSNYLETAAGPYGVGSCHVPANADHHYDYGNPRVVSSTASDFVNYPHLTGAAAPVSRDTWAMGPYPDYHRDYLNWYFAMMPRNDGTANDGRMANWFKYIWDFNSYEAGTGRVRAEDAFGSAPIVRRAGDTSTDLTVRYYDQTGIDITTLSSGNVRVVGPRDIVLGTSPLGPGVETATTAGTARTVTYRMTPPGGAWDFSDNGTYRIVMQADQVRDTEGNVVPPGEIGTFRVAIPDPAVIDIRAMLRAGEASVTHTSFDVGRVENLFDNNTSTLVRTPSINPAVITLTFPSPQTVTGFRSYFSHSFGDPAFRYMVEAADSLTDLNDRARSYRELVPLTSTVADQFSTVELPNAHTATVFRLTGYRLHGDDYVHLNQWQLLADYTPDTDAPTATLKTVAMPEAGRTSHFLEVEFTDATGIDVTSLSNGDLLVRGPAGTTIVPTFYDVDDHTDGRSRTGTYWFVPPGGAWSHSDDGVYTVELQASAVRDTLGNTASTPEVLGAFTVDLSPSWQNPRDNLDVNGDGMVTPHDVLLVVNELNYPVFVSPAGVLPASRPAGAPYLDVSGNGYCQPKDALIIINFINGLGQSEGESVGVAASLLEPPRISSLSSERVSATVERELDSGGRPDNAQMSPARFAPYGILDVRGEKATPRVEPQFYSSREGSAEKEWDSLLDEIAADICLIDPGNLFPPLP